MIILNFTHPLTPDQVRQSETPTLNGEDLTPQPPSLQGKGELRGKGDRNSSPRVGEGSRRILCQRTT